jgi:hypothetical protein
MLICDCVLSLVSQDVILAKMRWLSLLVVFPHHMFVEMSDSNWNFFYKCRRRHLLYQIVQSLLSHHVMCRSSVHHAVQLGRKAARWVNVLFLSSPFLSICSTPLAWFNPLYLFQQWKHVLVNQLEVPFESCYIIDILDIHMVRQLFSVPFVCSWY